MHTGWLGELYLYAGRYDEAIAEAKKGLAIDEKFAVGWLVLGHVYTIQGKYADAIAVHQRAAAINPFWIVALGETYAKAGRIDDARKILTELEAGPPTPFRAWGLLSLHTALGSMDEAFKWVAYEPHHAFVPWVRVMPRFARFRQDPRFPALMDKMKLPRRAS